MLRPLVIPSLPTLQRAITPGSSLFCAMMCWAAKIEVEAAEVGFASPRGAETPAADRWRRLKALEIRTGFTSRASPRKIVHLFSAHWRWRLIEVNARSYLNEPRRCRKKISANRSGRAKNHLCSLNIQIKDRATRAREDEIPVPGVRAKPKKYDCQRCTPTSMHRHHTTAP